MLTRVSALTIAAFIAVPESALVALVPNAQVTTESDQPFCARNPHTCAAPAEVLAVVQRKAVLVGQIAQQTLDLKDFSFAPPPSPFATEQPLPAHPPGLGTSDVASAPKSGGTLLPSDQRPAWRGTPDS